MTAPAEPTHFYDLRAKYIMVHFLFHIDLLDFNNICTVNIYNTKFLQILGPSLEFSLLLS